MQIPMPNKPLIIIGLLITLTGFLWPIISKIPFGKLPGDISVEKENFGFYFPVTSSIVVSILLTLLFKIFSNKP
jgi:hypothetical protein